jgi:transporter family-2 protein
VAVAGAVVAGVLLSLQSRMNGEISAVLGQPLEAALWSFGTGLLLLTALLAVPAVREGVGRIRAAVRGGRLTWWQCVGGLAGGLFVAVQTHAVPAVGVALFSVASVAGQTASGLLVDRLGIGPGPRTPVHASRVVAAVLAVGGVAVAVSGQLDGAAFALAPVVAALLVGALVAVQQGINARVNLASLNVLSTTWLNFSIGTGLLAGLAAVQWAAGDFRPVPLHGIPWWAWWGGPCGVAFISFAVWAVRHVGVLIFGLSLVTGQLSSALVLDLLHPQAREQVGPLVVAGVAVTFAAAALAGWAARPARRRVEGFSP